MPESALVALNLRSALSAYANATVEGVTAALPEMALVHSGVPFAVFNAAVLCGAVTHERFAELVEEAREFYRRRCMPWSCWYCVDHVRGDSSRAVERFLMSRGLRLTARHTGMYAERIEPPVRMLPRFEVARVCDRRSRRDFISVCLSAFGLPSNVAHAVYDAEGFWRGNWNAWVGYDERGVAVTTAATDFADGVVGVYCVGTMPRARGRGYGEAITRHALESAWEQIGTKATIVQSTPAGLSLYLRMGFRPVGEFAVFVDD